MEPLYVTRPGLMLSPLSPVLGGEGLGVRGRVPGNPAPPPQPLSPGVPGERGSESTARSIFSRPAVPAAGGARTTPASEDSINLPNQIRLPRKIPTFSNRHATLPRYSFVKSSGTN